MVPHAPKPAYEVSYRNLLPSEAINHCIEEGAARLLPRGRAVGECHGHVERAGSAVVVSLELPIFGHPVTLRRRLPGSAKERDVCDALRAAFRELAELAPAPH